MNYWLLALVVVVSYFIGNINFARILSRKKNVDITKQSSGNPGATNMYRTFGAKLGYLTLLLDAIKGVVSALLGLFVIGHGDLHSTQALIGIYSCGLSAMIGHCFPVIYGFKGGKGVSTMLGVFLVSMPVVALVCFVFGFIYVFFFKYLSVVSLLMVTVFVIYQNATIAEPNLAISLLTFAIWVLTWWAHRGNIERLLLGKENPTNIGKKIKKEQIKQQKRDEQKEIVAVKLEEKIEKKEEKAAHKEVKKATKKAKKKGHKYKKFSTKRKKIKK